MDYSFLKFYESIDLALNDNKFKDTQSSLFVSMQLLPNESYSQQTNVEGGVSFQGLYSVNVVDRCNNVVSNITDHVFIEEFVDVNGNTQCKIEIVNINKDFFGRAVFLRFSHNISDVVYFTRPIKITDKEKEKTCRFDYWSEEDTEGFSYENSQYKQSIRLRVRFNAYENSSEVGEYYQISSGNTISTRPMAKTKENYQIEQIDTFTFQRLSSLLSHDYIYIDGIRVTNKPIDSLDVGERLGRTNLFSCNFSAYTHLKDTYEYSFQLFEGLKIISFYPFGYNTLSEFVTETEYTAVFNTNISVGYGTFRVYHNTLGLINTYTEQNVSVDNENTLLVDGLDDDITQNGDYYIQMDSGLVVSSIGVPFVGINDNETWKFSVIDAQYEDTEYDNNEYLT